MQSEEKSYSSELDKSNVGFILTRSRREINGVSYVELWLTTDTGPVQLLSPPQKEVFFIHKSDSLLVKEQLSILKIPFTSNDVNLKTFAGEAVIAVYFDTSGSVYKAKQQLHGAGVVCYEDDIRLTERFLMERFVYGSTCFTGDLVKPSTGAWFYRNAHLKSAVYTPEFKVLSLDIECSEKGELYSIGLSSGHYHRVLMIGEACPDSPVWITWVENEKALLTQFVQVVLHFDPDIFIGWNVVNFDFKLLLSRAERHNINLNIGRGGAALIWRDAHSDVGKGYVTMAGRVVIDGISALKTATYHFDSFSLEFVAQAILGKGKKTEDVDNRMAAINYDFIHNKVKLAEYNLQDCILVEQIFSTTRLLDFLTLRTQLTGLELDKLGGSVAAFVNLYLPKLHRAGYVSPNRPEDGGLASPGGYVMESRPGLYEHVLVLDFKSLYPSIIRTFKIDPLGLVEGLLAYEAGGSTPEQAPIPGYKGAMFSRDKHFLPEIITSLWKQRDEAKKNSDAARSQAIKILMNSFYGVLGSGGCPFYDTRLASSITMRGHDIMQTTALWIEEAGYQVIYGDTDSIFVWLDAEYKNTKIQAIGLSLQKLINKKWSAKLLQEYQLQSELDIEFETHFSKFFMPTIRGSNLGSKKRYAGIKVDGGAGELIFKGLETVRSDWTELAKTFQTQLYTKVFAGLDVQNYLKQVVQDVLSGKYDQQLVYRKRLRRPLAEYVKNIPPHVKAARLADESNLALGKPLKYQNKAWISYVITLNGPEALEHRKSPFDYDHYIKKQIQAIADGILPFVGTSFGQIIDSQLRLFH